MSTIPYSALVNVTPGVIGAGGSSLGMNGLALTTNTRVPIGTVLSLPPSSVAGYFGAASGEAAFASVYGQGYNNAPQLPGALLFAQYPSSAVAAYLRGGNFAAANTVAQMNALSGSLTVVMDGYSHVISSISLATYSSYSAAATAIGAAFTDPTEASVTASIGGSFTTCTSSGTTLTLGAVASGSLWPGDLVSGTDTTNSLPAGCYIVKQLTGTPGGAASATFQLSAAATPGNLTSCTITGTSTVLDVTVLGSGTVAVGQTSSTTGNPVITAQLSGTAGGVGTYQLSGTAHGVASGSVTLTATAPVVTYDSVSGAFLITSGITGTPSTAAYVTGTLAASLLLTSATGATLSQGAAAATPGTFMTALTAITQNWVVFTTLFDPDGGSGNTQKLAFAAWANGQSNRYGYIAWDTDQSPVNSNPAASSLGYLVGPNGNNYSGTLPISEPSDLHLAAAALAYPACLNFGAANGRTTFMYRGQTGLTASCTNPTARANLIANGYTFLGAYGGANSQSVFFEPGSISGPYAWYDSFICQIWLNNGLQSSILQFMQTVNSFPYNNAGYALVTAACLPPIQAAVNFGAITPGVTLSASQIAAVNNAAGANIAGTISQRGWYLIIQPATQAVKAARGSPPMTLIYVDGESIQYINLNSLQVPA